MAQQPHKSFFKGGKAQTRPDNPDKGAWDIIDMEAHARAQKTARLKELRLQKEAAEKASETAKPAKPARKPKS